MKNNYICHAPYLRTTIAYDHGFWYTIVKWYLQVFFSFFWNFDFWGCLGVKGQKNGPKWKSIISIRHHISGPVWHCSWFLVHYCKMISPGTSFIFSKFWFLGLLRGKGQKTVQNDKKFCPLHSISEEPCIIWLSFMFVKW